MGSEAQAPPPSPLERAARALSKVLPTGDVARRWFDALVAGWGERAVVDTAEKGSIRWVSRSEVGGRGLLPSPALAWTTMGSPGPDGMDMLDVLEIYDGEQKIAFAYRRNGPRVETQLAPQHPGRLTELSGLLAREANGFAASLAFVAALDDARWGPGRVHYPVPWPGGVQSAWHMGLMGCRRALHEGRVDAGARFVVADGLEGRAVGGGRHAEQALLAYAAEVARALPARRVTMEFANDDYDDDGRLIERGGFEGQLGEAAGHERELPSDDEPIPGSSVMPLSLGAPEPQIDPVTGEVDLLGGTLTLRGPRSDAPSPTPSPAAVPHVLIQLEASPATPPAHGRWVRLLGRQGVTRHAVRLKDGDGFVLVGADLLGHVDLRTLRGDLDRIDAELAERGETHRSMFERFTRYRAERYAWQGARGTRPAGLAWVGGESGPRFEAGELDGDLLQAQVRRQRRVLRLKD